MTGGFENVRKKSTPPPRKKFSAPLPEASNDFAEIRFEGENRLHGRFALVARGAAQLGERVAQGVVRERGQEKERHRNGQPHDEGEA